MSIEIHEWTEWPWYYYIAGTTALCIILLTICGIAYIFETRTQQNRKRNGIRFPCGHSQAQMVKCVRCNQSAMECTRCTRRLSPCRCNRASERLQITPLPNRSMTTVRPPQVNMPPATNRPSRVLQRPRTRMPRDQSARFSPRSKAMNGPLSPLRSQQRLQSAQTSNMPSRAPKRQETRQIRGGFVRMPQRSQPWNGRISPPRSPQGVQRPQRSQERELETQQAEIRYLRNRPIPTREMANYLDKRVQQTRSSYIDGGTRTPRRVVNTRNSTNTVGPQIQNRKNSR